MTLEGGLVKTLTWFDNGWAYAARMLELAEAMAQSMEGG
jgi:glyceraldehyde-3-phosphate dehydrogenase/erythrose-4-phosphate dehydrogenase